MAATSGRIVVQRTVEHLRRGNVVLGQRVSKLVMNSNIRGDGTLGARHFLYHNVPQLKYRNPHVKFDLRHRHEPSTFLSVIFADGNEVQINCSYRTSSAILQELQHICAN